MWWCEPGEFEGERNVCVDVGLGHGYTEIANTKSSRSQF